MEKDEILEDEIPTEVELDKAIEDVEKKDKEEKKPTKKKTTKKKATNKTDKKDEFKRREDYKYPYLWRDINPYIPLTPLTYDPNEGVEDRKQFRAYKQFLTLYNPEDESTKKYKGKLFPLYVQGDVKDTNNIDGKKGTKIKDYVEVGKWYRCGQGVQKQAVWRDEENPKKPANNPSNPEFPYEIFLNSKNKPKFSVGSKLSALSFRPGWHCGKYPLTRHIGVDPLIDEDGNIILGEDGLPLKADDKLRKKRKDLYPDFNDYDYYRAQNVWAEVEFSGKNDFTNDEANGENGIFHFRDDESDKYKDGFYYFKTNTNAKGAKEDWIIADAIKVVRVIKDDELDSIINRINREEHKNFVNQHRWHPDKSDGNEFTADFSQFENITESEKSEMFNNVFKRFN